MDERIVRSDNDLSRVEDLHLDRVVSSQPEIGPTPPDGGYGWLIISAAAKYNITTPGLLILYGFVILRSLRDEDHDVGEKYKIWDVDIALVPVLMVVMKLLMESWCRVIVKLFNVPRFMALSGLCMTVAGVLLSSFSTNPEDNDNIINVFAGIFIGTGWALTGQQTEVIITHYFREKLSIAQRIVRIAPSISHCVIPLVVGYLCTKYTSDSIVMIYAAILMQNCFLLASYTRPIYIEKVVRDAYKRIRDAVEDEDEVIFSNQNQPSAGSNTAQIPQTSNEPHPDDDQIVVFNRQKNATEVLDPTVQNKENRFSSNFTDQPVSSSQHRFSSDFGSLSIEVGSNRFSSDFSNYDVTTQGYQELRDIDRAAVNPEPLYRETTVSSPDEGILAYAVNPDTVGTARRTASLRKNFITIVHMLMDVEFYLYTLLHLCTTYSTLMLGVVFPPLIWELNQSSHVWGVACVIAVAHTAAFFGVIMCVVLPKSLNNKSRLCALFCAAGAFGFYGATISTTNTFIVISGMLAGFSTNAACVLQQPIYNNMLNEFDTTATTAASNTFVAAFILIWSVLYNYEYAVCFYIASALQALTGCVYLAASFKRRRT